MQNTFKICKFDNSDVKIYRHNMNITLLDPRKAINKAFLKIKPSRNFIESFKTNLIELIDFINENFDEMQSFIESEMIKEAYEVIENAKNDFNALAVEREIKTDVAGIKYTE